MLRGYRLTGLVLLCFLAGVTAPHPSAAQHARIVNGLPTSQYPTTGALLDSDDPDRASALCSGTLIGCQTFLTAGHCVEGFLDPSNYLVFLQHAGFFAVSSVALHPDYQFPPADVAVLKLSSQVTGIAPTAIDTVGGHADGTVGTIAGFGRSGGANGDFGLKRFGAVEIAPCSFDVSDVTSICWNFTNPVGAPGDDSNTCNGDSGGPLFIDAGAGNVVAGITSGGNNTTCLPTDNSFDARVSFYAPFIQAQGGADLNNTSCGSIAQVGEPEVGLSAFSGTVSAESPQGRHSMRVAAGTTLLRIAMNAIDDGSDFDLYVKAGAPPTSSDFDCAANGPNQYGFCEFDTPVSGTWHLLVQRFSGSGAYQLTTTTFSSCSDPLNEGQPCDDNNECTENDVCQSQTCTGAPVLDGTPCEDGSVCTQADSCQAGACTSGTDTFPGCRQRFIQGRGSFRIRDKDPNKRDRLSWAWARGTQTSMADFGDPLTSTDYTMCIYDQTDGVNALKMEAHVPAGGTCRGKPCWKPQRRGFRFTDRDATTGLNAIILRQGDDGKAKITVRGKGESLAPPAPPLVQDEAVVVQLSNGTTCWESVLSTYVKNEPGEFRANSD